MFPDGACRQTFEFGNTGCAEVRGRVVGAAGQTLAGISVVPWPVSTQAAFATDYAMTDGAGQFRVRMSRMIGRPPEGGAPDTLSVWIVAADPRSAGVGVPANVRDSVLTVVTVAAVGTVPTSAEVHITLAVP